MLLLRGRVAILLLVLSLFVLETLNTEGEGGEDDVEGVAEFIDDSRDIGTKFGSGIPPPAIGEAAVNISLIPWKKCIVILYHFYDCYNFLLS
mmetsp:Transcript_12148/g.17583  ORF Transcript_12148/g.17583 Transcript_12148/m.17583 type:complete len:92 (+) Transcript_12148:511-786(+)